MHLAPFPFPLVMLTGWTDWARRAGWVVTIDFPCIYSNPMAYLDPQRYPVDRHWKSGKSGGPYALRVNRFVGIRLLR